MCCILYPRGPLVRLFKAQVLEAMKGASLSAGARGAPAL